MIKNIKKTISAKKLFIIIGLLVITGFTGFILLIQDSPEPDSPNTKTLAQGTQMKYEEIYIGLVNVSDGAGALSIHKEGDTGEPLKKTFTAGEKFEAYGYTIEVKSVKKVIYLNFLPGASNGSVKLVVTRK